MLKRSAAIVLHVTKYNDTSSIVNLFTETDGAQAFVVSLSQNKRAKMKRAFFSSLTILEVEWDDGRKSKLPRLKNVICSQPFQTILFDPYKTTMVLFLSEFLNVVLRQEQSNPSLFSFVTNSFQWLEQKEGTFSNFHIVFMLRISQFLGFQPNLENYTEGCIFDLINGDFTTTYPVHQHYIKAENAIFIMKLSRIKYASMHLFKLTHIQRDQILSSLLLYYRLHIPNMPELKSLDILRQIFDDSR